MKQSPATKNKTRIAIPCLLLFSVFFFMTSSYAENLNIDTDRMFLSDTMHVDAGSNQANGSLQVFSIPGKHFLAIPLQYTIAWDDKTPQVKIPADQFMLVDEQGKQSPVLGELDYYSGLKTFFSGITSSRPDKWTERKDKPKKIIPVFAIEKPGAKYILKIGGTEVPVTAPDKTTDLGPGLIANFTITAAARADNVNAKLTINKTDYITTVYPLTGTYLTVKMMIEPNPPTKFESEYFYWNTSWFGVVDENGSFSPVAGEIFFDKLSDNVSHNKSKTSAGWKTEEITLYFSVAKPAKKFTLYCLGKPVADINLP